MSVLAGRLPAELLVVLSGFFIIVFTCFPSIYAMSFSYSFNTEELVFSKIITEGETYDYIYIDGMRDPSLNGSAGAPSIPSKILKLIIPSGMTIKDVTVNNVTIQILPDTYYLYPAQNPYIPREEPVFVPPDTSIYDSPNPYPEEALTAIGSRYEEGCYPGKFSIWTVKNV